MATGLVPATIWKGQGTYETTLFEMFDTGAGVFRLPQTNDILYCGPNGILTPEDPSGTGASQQIAVCRRGPTLDSPFMLFDLSI